MQRPCVRTWAPFTQKIRCPACWVSTARTTDLSELSCTFEHATLAGEVAQNVSAVGTARREPLLVLA